MKILILSILLIIAKTHEIGECYHGIAQEIANKQWEDYLKEEEQKLLNDQEFKQQHQRRNLANNAYAVPQAGVNAQPIRINFDTSSFDSTSNTNLITQQQIDFILELVKVAKSFYETRLSVVRYSQNIVVGPSKCGQMFVPSADRSTGIADTDFYVYVTVENSPSQSYGAYASYCQNERYADNSVGRPLVGNLNFNVATMTEFDAAAFARYSDTTMHELCHAMVFSAGLFSFFRSPIDGLVYSSVMEENVTVRGLTTNILKTPNVRNWAAKQFGCSRINDDSETNPIFMGMQLENQGGTGSKGAHWERTMVYDEVMTATTLGPSKTFSGLTFALFMDSGFYAVDNSNEEQLLWGFQKGCDFYEKACTDTNQVYDEFCSTENAMQCAADRVTKGGCLTDPSYLEMYFMDGNCGFIVPYGNARCIAQEDAQFENLGSTKQTFQYSDSRCFESTLGGGSIKCYKYSCTQDPHIEIDFNNGQTATCTSGGQEIFDAGSMFGTLTCPDPFKFCSQQRQYCPNWCSSKGYCTDGVCNCMTGFIGEDCSKTTCPGGQDITTHYWDNDTSQCITAAACCGSPPCANYTNDFNRVCEKCSNLCATCERGGSDKCKSCQSGLYLYITDAVNSEGKCFDTCPQQYYADGSNICRSCIGVLGLSANCETCNSTDKCTKCFSGYLNKMSAGDWKCDLADAQACIDAGGKVDNETNTCYNAGECPSNKAEVGDECRKCDASIPEYMHLTTCVGSCPSTHFANKVTQACEQCNAACVTCFGPKASNCLSCQSNTYYLFGGRCFTDPLACPNGSYGNEDPTTKECVKCHEKCLLCTGPLVSQCQDCNYGYYLDIGGTTCTDSCQAGEFKNKVERKCQACHGSCKSCKKEREIDCISCNNPQVLVINGSEYTCEDDCPDGQYDDSQICTSCHYTCKSCTGGSSGLCPQCENIYTIV